MTERREWREKRGSWREDWQEYPCGSCAGRAWSLRQEEAARGARAQEITEFNLNNFHFLKGGRFVSVCVCVCRSLSLLLCSLCPLAPSALSCPAN